MKRLIRIQTAILAGICMAIVAAPVSPGAAAGPSGGTRYHSDGWADGRHVAISVSRDGRRVKRMFVGVHMKCSDGDTVTKTFTFDDIRIGPGGVFKATFDSGPVLNETASSTDRLVVTITGRRTRTRVTGTVRVTFGHVEAATGNGWTCESGLMRYSAGD